jgi:hypothetical protein
VGIPVGGFTGNSKLFSGNGAGIVATIDRASPHKRFGLCRLVVGFGFS